MASYLRIGLFAVGFASAVAVGYLLKPVAKPAPACPPPIVVNLPEAPRPTGQPVPELLIPELPSPATKLGEPDIDRSDIAYKVIANQLGIKTTILDQAEPLPILQVGLKERPAKDDEFKAPPIPGIAKKEALPDSPPTLKDELLPPKPPIAIPSLDLPPIPSREAPLANQPPQRIPCFNTRSVSFDFEVTKVGPSKVKAVELWATRDLGKTWAKHDRMIGDQSPFRTQLGGEGTYGFKLVFESESGKRTNEPAAGVFPDLFAQVDLTPPTVRLSEPDSTNVPGTIRLAWIEHDANIDRLATRLEFSVDGRSWKSIELPKEIRPDDPIEVQKQAQLQVPRFTNRQIDWKVPEGLPHQLYFRVTARDFAGNEATAELPHKVSVDLVVPEGRLTRVERTRVAEPGPKPREVGAVHGGGIFSFYAGFLSR